MINPISDSDEVSERFVDPVRTIIGQDYRAKIKYGDWLTLEMGGAPGFKVSSSPRLGFRICRSKQ